MDEDSPEKAPGATGDDLAQYKLDEYDEEDNMPGDSYLRRMVFIFVLNDRCS